MKSFLFFITFFIVIFIFNSCQTIYDSSIEYAKNGYIDLSQSQFDNGYCVSLRGEWEFYWMNIYTPQDFQSQSQINPDGYINVPEEWNSFELNGTNLSGWGYATYRLNLQLPTNLQQISFKIRSVSTSYRLYVNDRFILENGRLATNRNQQIPYISPVITNIDLNTNHIQLVINAANFYERKGGLWEDIIIGNSDEIFRKYRNILWLEIFLVGNLIIMSLYHFGLFILRRRDQSTLFFGIFCLLIAIRIGVTGNMFLPRVFPWMGWTLNKKLEYLTFYLSVGIFNMYIWKMFPEIIKRKVAIIIFWISIFFSALVVFFPAHIFSQSLLIYQIITLISGVYLISGIFKQAILKQTQETVIIAVGSSILFLTVINDMIYAQIPFILPFGHLLPWGILIFIFSQSYSLSSRFSRAMNTVEELSKDLENQVKIRTQDLEKAREEINRLIELNLNVTQKIYSDLYVKQIAEHLILEAKNFTEFSDVSVFLHSPDTGYLEYIAGYGRKGIEMHRFKPGEGVAGHVFLTGKPELITDLNSDPRFIDLKDNPNALISFPIQTQDEVIGVFNLGYDDPEYLDQSHYKLLSILVSTAGIAIEKAQLYQSLEKKVRQRTEQLNKAKKEAEKANYNKTRFLANMSHELRTPLANIIGFVELLIYGSLEKGDEIMEKIKILKEYNIDEISINVNLTDLLNQIDDNISWRKTALTYFIEGIKYQIAKQIPDNKPSTATIDEILELIIIEETEITKNYGKIRNSGKQLLNLIESILNLSNVELGKIEVNITQFNFREFILQEVDFINNFLLKSKKNNSIAFNYNIDDEIPNLVAMDFYIVRQILRHILKNAVQFTHEGSINLMVIADPDRKDFAKFIIEDTGIGINELDKKNIFLTFGRGDVNRENDGSGFGLVLSHKLVEHHGGEIGYDSQPGEGSIFWFTLPWNGIPYQF